jgi:hypothetical protein
MTVSPDESKSQQPNVANVPALAWIFERAWGGHHENPSVIASVGIVSLSTLILQSEQYWPLSQPSVAGWWSWGAKCQPPGFRVFFRPENRSSRAYRNKADLFHPLWRTSVVTAPPEGVAMISLLIGILIICVVGAICFWAIDKFVSEARLANLLKLLVVLICLGAILQRVLPLAGINWL